MTCDIDALWIIQTYKMMYDTGVFWSSQTYFETCGIDALWIIQRLTKRCMIQAYSEVVRLTLRRVV